MKAAHFTLTVCLVGGVLLCSSAPGAVLTVGNDGWQAYTSIQAAVNDAVAGDVIKVFPGNYQEQVVVRNLSDLAIEGEQATIYPPAGMLARSLSS